MLLPPESFLLSYLFSYSKVRMTDDLIRMFYVMISSELKLEFYITFMACVKQKIMVETYGFWLYKTISNGRESKIIIMTQTNIFIFY